MSRVGAREPSVNLRSMQVNPHNLRSGTAVAMRPARLGDVLPKNCGAEAHREMRPAPPPLSRGDQRVSQPTPFWQRKLALPARDHLQRDVISTRLTVLSNTRNNLILTTPANDRVD